VLLVKKSYSERRRKPRRRAWKLQSLAKEQEESEWTAQRGRKLDTSQYEQEYEEFMQDLEEDPEMRAQINLYRDPEADRRAAAQAAQAAASGAASGGDGDGDGEEAEDDDFPDVGLEELLDELTLGADEPEADALTDEQVASVAGAFAGPSGPVQQFSLPEGNKVKYSFL